MGEKKISISEKDLYCISKLLQSSIYTRNQFTGCQYCPYDCSIEREDGVTEIAVNYDEVIHRLQEITGVDFGYQTDDPPKRIQKDKSRCGDSDF